MNSRGGSAYSEASLDDSIGTTDHDFGEGYEKTGEMITRWNNSTYGSQNARDVWGLIQDEYADGWFVPSKGEWSAFAGELGEDTLSPALSSTNFSSTYGLTDYYWSSSQFNAGYAYITFFCYNYMYGVFPHIEHPVRLCATF